MKKKIAFISEHASPLAALGGTDSGGQNVYVGQLALQMELRGYEIDIFTRWDNPTLPKVVAYSPGIRVVHVKAGPVASIGKEDLLCYMDDFKKDMLRFIDMQRLKYKLIHANFFMSGLVAMQLKEILGIPFVITFHALGHVRKIFQKDQDHFPPQRIQIEEAIVRQADRLIAECPQDFDDLVNYYNADPEKIGIIPCGFNPMEFFPMQKKSSKKRLHIADDEAMILQLGRMVPRKGIDNVIKAMPLVKCRDKKLKLVIVGGEAGEQAVASELNRLKALVKELKLEHQVVFAGRKDREELKYYYNAADVFITTPWYEPFGITPLESMACGTPVIGATVGGIKHSVVDGETGFLVEPHQPQLLADKISMLLNNQNLLDHMGLQALKHVHLNFTWEKVAGRMHDLYETVLSEERRLLQSAIQLIETAFEEAAETFHKSAMLLAPQVAEAAALMSKALENGHKILVCGNGGSAAESQHFAAELVGRFEIPKRRGLPVMALTADNTILTAWANDFGFEEVFSRQVSAFGKPGDILLCLSTSGHSPNIINALTTAEEIGMTCINMLGKDGGEAAAYGDVNLIVPSNSTPRIQEVHLHLVHLLCSLIENRLFTSSSAEKAQDIVPLKIINRHATLRSSRLNSNPQHYGS